MFDPGAHFRFRTVFRPLNLIDNEPLLQEIDAQQHNKINALGLSIGTD
jgi:hypothetical protein